MPIFVNATSKFLCHFELGLGYVPWFCLLFSVSLILTVSGLGIHILYYAQICEAWSEWGLWSECTTTCGVGESVRARECIHGEVGSIGCQGEQTEVSNCSIKVIQTLTVSSLFYRCAGATFCSRCVIQTFHTRFGYSIGIAATLVRLSSKTSCFGNVWTQRLISDANNLQDDASLCDNNGVDIMESTA